ncbi:unnamed protein product [Staurois parvus]|uniref:Uncharacterized protein n=1 Tax=Staurois parvus TaxID=386267 RepID=A0ABN9F050_9NEOB|nr:unnamed protein product [Staurois parvus]
MLRLVHIAREVFISSWENACDQHRANQHCADRGQGYCILLEQNVKLLRALTCALLDTDRSHKTALTADEEMYLVVYIY